MLTINGSTIRLTRGDSAIIEITLAYQDGTAFKPERGDEIRFALKKNYADSKTLLKIEVPTEELPLLLRFRPSDTKRLDYGSYKYDLQLTRADGTVDTFIDRATFIVTEEVE